MDLHPKEPQPTVVLEQGWIELPGVVDVTVDGIDARLPDADSS